MIRITLIQPLTFLSFFLSQRCPQLHPQTYQNQTSKEKSKCSAIPHYPDSLTRTFHPARSHALLHVVARGERCRVKRPTCNSSLCGTTDTEHIIIMEEKRWLSNTGNVVYFCLSYRRTKREEEEKKEKVGVEEEFCRAKIVGVGLS